MREGDPIVVSRSIHVSVNARFGPCRRAKSRLQASGRTANDGPSVTAHIEHLSLAGRTHRASAVGADLPLRRCSSVACDSNAGPSLSTDDT